MSEIAVAPDKVMNMRAACQKKGLLVATGADGTIRLAPHFDSSSKVIEEGVKKLYEAIQEAAG